MVRQRAARESEGKTEGRTAPTVKGKGGGSTACGELGRMGEECVEGEVGSGGAAPEYGNAGGCGSGRTNEIGPVRRSHCGGCRHAPNVSAKIPITMDSGAAFSGTRNSFSCARARIRGTEVNRIRRRPVVRESPIQERRGSSSPRISRFAALRSRWAVR